MIWEIIKNHKGKEQAILGPVISEMTGIEYDRIRSVISHLVKEHYCLIASYSRGYYMPHTWAEKQEATRSLRHRGIMIFFRASRLMKTSIETEIEQAKLEFNNATAKI